MHFALPYGHHQKIEFDVHLAFVNIDSSMTFCDAPELVRRLVYAIVALAPGGIVTMPIEAEFTP